MKIALHGNRFFVLLDSFPNLLSVNNLCTLLTLLFHLTHLMKKSEIAHCHPFFTGRKIIVYLLTHVIEDFSAVGTRDQTGGQSLPINRFWSILKKNPSPLALEDLGCLLFPLIFRPSYGPVFGSALYIVLVVPVVYTVSLYSPSLYYTQN